MAGDAVAGRTAARVVHPASHCFVLDELMRHIEEIEARIARFDARLLQGVG